MTNSKKDKGWIEGENGFSLVVGDTCLTIEQWGTSNNNARTQWRLSYHPHVQDQTIARSVKPLWQANTVEECKQVARAWESWIGSKAKFFERSIFRKKVLDKTSGNSKNGLEGVEIVARRTIDGNLAIRAWDPEDSRKEIGYLSTEYTGFLPSLVFGEPTVNSASWIDQKWRGLGLCYEMCSFQEEVFGLPPVPHGHNLVAGDQSQDAAKFWSKRATHHRVPGLNDPSVQARLEKIQPIYDRFEMEASVHNRWNSELMVALSWSLDCKILAFQDADSGIFQQTLYAACLPSTKQAFGGLGPTSVDWLKNDVYSQGENISEQTYSSSQFLEHLSSQIIDVDDWEDFKKAVMNKSELAARILRSSGYEVKPGLEQNLDQSWQAKKTNEP